MVRRVEAEHHSATTIDPLERDGVKKQDKALDTGCRFKAEDCACHLAEKKAMEVVNEGGVDHEGSVGLHFGEGQAALAEVIVHTVKTVFCGGPLVVEFHYLPFAGECVVGWGG